MPTVENAKKPTSGWLVVAEARVAAWRPRRFRDLRRCLRQRRSVLQVLFWFVVLPVVLFELVRLLTDF